MYLWTIILVFTIALSMEWIFVNVAASEGESCQSDVNCTGVYRKCCAGKCSQRKYCLNICSVNHDCASKETCVQQRCIKSCDQDHDCTWQGSIYKACCKKMCSTTTNCDKVCRSDRDCITGETCLLQLCMSFGVNKDCNGNNECSTTKVVNCGGNCRDNEDCIDGECQKKSAFSTASIVGFMVVVIIGSCIACVVYCGCARTTGQRMRPTNQQQQQLNTRGSGTNVIQEGGPPTPPVLPGGPPPYESLERLDETEEPPPPTYEEAVRNSQNLNTSVV